MSDRKCTRCGFACDEADTPLYFNKRYKGARGTWESHCKACRNAQRADREARKRKDPAHIAAKNQRNRESYQRRRETVLAKLAEKRAAKRAAKPTLPPSQPKPKPKAKAKRPMHPSRSGARLSTALEFLDRALIAANSEDETLRKFHRVVRAIWTQVIAREISKGA